MLSKRDLKVFIAGVVVAVIFSGSFTIFAADTVLKQLYVDYSAVKKIVIDGVEKKPADDMKPFVANGRSYVALRYIADAFGKEINFDSKTGTITIGAGSQEYKGSMNMSSSDDFSGTLKKWYVNLSENSTLKNWKIDGPNGLFGDGGGWLNYKDIYEEGKAYTQEVDVAVDTENTYAGLITGYDKDHHFCNYVQIGYKTGWDGSEWGEESRIKIATSRFDYIKYESGFELNKFYHIKAVYNNDGNVDIYIDNKFISTYKCQGIGFSLGLIVTDLQNNIAGKAHFKNYTITCNEK